VFSFPFPVFLIEARCEGSAQFTSTLRLSGAYVCGVCLWCGVLCVWCGCERVYGGGCPLFFLRAEGSCAAVLSCKVMGKPHCLIASLLCSVLRMRVSVTSAGAWIVQYLLVCLRAPSCPVLLPSVHLVISPCMQFQMARVLSVVLAYRLQGGATEQSLFSLTAPLVLWLL